MATTELSLLAIAKYQTEDALERAYSQICILPDMPGISAEDLVRADQVKTLLEEAYTITKSMSIQDTPQVAWLRKSGEDNRRDKGRSNPFE